jgi:hypothetical protein
MKTAMAIGVLILAAAGAVEAQVPTFGSPMGQQRVEIRNKVTGDRLVLTLSKRADGDYDVESLDIDSGRRSSGVLRADTDVRYSGDIFDHAKGTFREVVLVERGGGVFGIEQFDYATGKRVRGTMRCGEAGCTYRAD